MRSSLLLVLLCTGCAVTPEPFEREPVELVEVIELPSPPAARLIRDASGEPWAGYDLAAAQRLANNLESAVALQGQARAFHLAAQRLDAEADQLAAALNAERRALAACQTERRYGDWTLRLSIGAGVAVLGALAL